MISSNWRSDIGRGCLSNGLQGWSSGSWHSHCWGFHRTLIEVTFHTLYILKYWLLLFNLRLLVDKRYWLSNRSLDRRSKVFTLVNNLVLELVNWLLLDLSKVLLLLNRLLNEWIQRRWSYNFLLWLLLDHLSVIKLAFVWWRWYDLLFRFHLFHLIRVKDGSLRLLHVLLLEGLIRVLVNKLIWIDSLNGWWLLMNHILVNRRLNLLWLKLLLTINGLLLLHNRSYWNLAKRDCCLFLSVSVVCT